MMEFLCICDHGFVACDHILKTTKMLRFALSVVSEFPFGKHWVYST
ncbi:hypothetical protein TRIHO_06830 [Tritonibacter horizontis]|uniref:Uncharacterized protein n=1 Tax=Tritonibacter horizontis TaxID=1768241 RepID=A0A132C187_9RHOB|nr:hypothetical protein TRIHO_06830 [Tritonibacter horizontis]